MNSIQSNWNIFKESWNEQIEKTQSNLFFEFDKFISEELQHYSGNKKKKITVKKICISNKSVNSIKYKEKFQVLYIYESPFYMTLFDGIKYSSALFLENFLLEVIRFIKHNNNEIKVIRLHNNEDEDENI